MMPVFIKFFCSALFFYLAVLIFLYVYQRHLIYFPDSSSPSTIAGAEDIHVTTSDGLSLRAWYYPPAIRYTACYLFSFMAMPVIWGAARSTYTPTGNLDMVFVYRDIPLMDANPGGYKPKR
jgi:hypothetical protein